jgi:calcineurin-like phosphoesterase family protein
MHFDRLTSDLHIGHLNMRLWRGMGESHPEMDEFDQEVIDRYNSVVGPKDHVLIFGDLCMGRIDFSLPLVSELHGFKWYIPGNHDRSWVGSHKPNDRDGVSWVQRYQDVGLQTIMPGVIDIDGIPEPVKVDHFPYYGDHGDIHGSKDRYPEWRPTEEGHWLIHGHSHDLWKQHGIMINVGIDAWGGYPTNPDAVAELMAAGPQWVDADAEWGFGKRPESLDN